MELPESLQLEPGGSMEKLEADLKQIGKFRPPLAGVSHCQQTLIDLIP